MRATSDLFGTVLLEYLDGSRVPVHLRRGDGRISLLDVERYFAPFDSFSSLEQSLLREARGDTLDLGAGAGRAGLYLEEQALRTGSVGEVVAVDSSPGACLTMRRRGLGTVVRAGWEDLAMNPDMCGRFDTIVLLGAGLGIAGTTGGLMRLLSTVRGLLRPAGLAIVTASVPASGQQFPSCMRLRVESRGRVGEWFRWLAVPPDALRLAAGRCGLTAVREPPCDAGGEYGVVLVLSHDSRSGARR